MDPDRPEYCEFVGFEDGGTMRAHLENYRRRSFDDISFQRGVVQGLRHLEGQLVPDVEFGREWRQFCSVAVATLDYVPTASSYIERLLEKWVTAPGHALKTVLYSECTRRVMGAAASRLAKQRPLGFAALVTVIRDRVLSGTDLPTSARINLIEAFAIGKATEERRRVVEAENKAPVAKPRTNPSARMTVKQPEGHDPEVQAVVCPSRKETRAPPVAGEVERKNSRWEVLVLAMNHSPNRFPLEAGGKAVIFGRSKKLCHVAVGNIKASRQHCKIGLRDGDECPHLTFISKNFIEVNGLKIYSEDLSEDREGLKTLSLEANDVVRVGEVPIKIISTGKKADSPVQLGVGTLPPRLPRPTPVRTASAEAVAGSERTKIGRARQQSPDAFPVTATRRLPFFGFNGSDNSDVIVEREEYL